MNTNLLHNIINVVMILLAALTAALLAMGCVSLPNGDLSCSDTLFISPTMATTIVTVLGIVKMLVNIIRDGFAGLAKKQPPVQ
jgi:hypothetical protein